MYSSSSFLIILSTRVICLISMSRFLREMMTQSLYALGPKTMLSPSNPLWTAIHGFPRGVCIPSNSVNRSAMERSVLISFSYKLRSLNFPPPLFQNIPKARRSMIPPIMNLPTDMARSAVITVSTPSSVVNLSSFILYDSRISCTLLRITSRLAAASSEELPCAMT